MDNEGTERAARVARPVTLPPGRARLATRLFATGSPAVANAIGALSVPSLRAIIAREP